MEALPASVRFLDAARFVHGLFLRLGLVPGVLLAADPSGRHRLSVLGALNATTHQLITVTTDAYINSQHAGRMLYKLAALGLTVPITVVLDNARYQRCGLVQRDRHPLEHRGCCFCRPYSPQFNLIERFWKW